MADATIRISEKSRGRVYVYGSVKGQGPQEIPADESYTVSKAVIRAGGFGEAPAHMNHYAWTSEETVVQVHGHGPFVLTYVNPADDPSK